MMIQEKLKSKCEETKKERSEIKQIQKHHMKQLLTDIFPIDLIYLNRRLDEILMKKMFKIEIIFSKNSNQVTADRELEEQLDDARNLEFIGGNWVANEVNYSVF